MPDLTLSDLMAGVADGDDKMGAEPIEPNVPNVPAMTAEPCDRVSKKDRTERLDCAPCFAALGPLPLFLGMLTLSFLATRWPALGRGEWVRWDAFTGLSGAGD
jgi:hypothetical protein